MQNATAHNAASRPDSIFAQAMLGRAVEMTKTPDRATSSEVAVHLQLIARAEGGVPEDLKEQLGKTYIQLLAGFDIERVFDRNDLGPGLRTLGMTPAGFDAELAKRRSEKEARQRRAAP